ncbi:MAG: Wzz/FepE/Etk N-terminal domain-containing protein [Candidatus Promineifilaceae bacterium]|nr:Wzz/FepE/Etk N-terminal domain-containing protein [Candidatus Promineifilaceae bacterium]
MEIQDYIRILKRRGWLVILLAVLTAAAAFAFSKMQTPVYEASARLLITSRPDFGQTQAARSELRNYAEYLRSSYRAAAVIDELQLDMTPWDLMGDMTVAAGTSETVIQIDVENTDPEVAKNIAEVWAQQLIIYRQHENAALREEDRIKAQLLDAPTVHLERPQTMINTAAGALFGALLGIIVIFVLEWIESGILRRAEDVERYLDIPVIGTIPQQ